MKKPTLCLAIALFFLLGSTVGASKIKLVVATHINDPAQYEEQERIMRGFEEIRPDVEIEVWYSPWAEYHDRLLTMYLGGTGPDVVSIGRFQFASFIEAGLLQPLDEFIERDPHFNLAEDVIGGVMSSGLYKGSVYGFPIYNGPALLFYNPNTFSERGVAEPVDYIANDNWNRDTFLDVAKKLTYDRSGSGVPDHFGYYGYTSWHPMWLPYLRHAGGDPVRDDGRSGLNSPEVIESLEWLNDLNVVHGVTAHPGPGGASWDNGSIAMHIRWQAEGLREKTALAAVDPEPALIPAGPAGYAHVVGGVPVAVSQTTKHADVAYEYAKWLGTQSGIWKLRGGPPLSWEELRSPEFQSTLSAFRNPHMFELALAVGDTRPEPEFGVVDYQEMTRILNDVLINPIRNGLVSVRVAVEEAHRFLDAMLDEE